MVESCGCAQYTQPLPAGAEYCNYKKNPNWSKCWDTPTPLPAAKLSAQHSSACVWHPHSGWERGSVAHTALAPQSTGAASRLDCV